ncbi:MAG: chemotaxis protein CheW [Desulfurivibrionaceae bacterium]
MSAIYQLTLSDHRFAVRKEDVATAMEVERVHRLPFSPEHIVGLAMIDRRRIALADLAALIGLPSFAGKYPAQVIIGAGEGAESGFIFAGELAEIEIGEESFHRMPRYLATAEISSCLDYRGRAVPIIDLKALYRLINAGKLTPSLPTFPAPDQRPPAPEPKSIKLCKAGGEVFGLPGEIADRVFDKPLSITALPATPPFIKGVAFVDNFLSPVIDLTGKIDLPARIDQAERLLNIDLGEDRFFLLVDAYLGEIGDHQYIVHHLPPLAQSPLIKSIVVYDGELIPLLEPPAILDPDLSAQKKYSPPEHSYRLDSKFSRHFNHRDIEVVEFILLGEKHALPREEVEDILPVSSFRKLPGLQSLVIGIIMHQDRIVPILDPALVFGRFSPISLDWQMILIKNGDFLAFIVSESTFPDRKLPLSIHKEVPLSHSDSLVYGCYPDANRVRLIINAADLATRFDKNGVREFLSSHTAGLADTSSQARPLAGLKEKTLLLDLPAKFREQTEVGAGVPEIPAETRKTQQPGREITAPPDSSREPGAIKAKTYELPEDKSGGITSSIDQSLNDEIMVLPHSAECPLPLKPGTSGQLPEEPKPAGNAGNAAPPSPREPESPLNAIASRSLSGMSVSGESPAREAAEAAGNNPPISAEQSAEEILKPAPPMEQGTDNSENAAELLAGMHRIIARQKQKEPGSRFVQKKAQTEAEEPPQPIAADSGPDQKSEKRRQADEVREFEKTLLGGEAEIPSEKEPPIPTSSEDHENRQLEEAELPPALPAAVERQNRSSRARSIVLLSLLLMAMINLFILWSPPDHKPEKLLTVPKDRSSVANQIVADLKSATAEPAVAEPDEPLAASPGSPELVTGALKRERPTLTITVPDNIPLPTRVYTVKKGDTLWAISKRFTGTPYNYPSVANENDIANPDLIYPEQAILLKKEHKP